MPEAGGCHAIFDPRVLVPRHPSGRNRQATAGVALPWLLVWVLALLPPGARAQLPVSSPEANSLMPRCSPQMDGQVFCKFGAIYECRFTEASAMERHTGWQWQQDPLRACEAPSPASASQPESLPPGFTYAPQMGGGAGQSGATSAQAASGSAAAAPSGQPGNVQPNYAQPGYTEPSYGRASGSAAPGSVPLGTPAPGSYVLPNPYRSMRRN